MSAPAPLPSPLDVLDAVFVATAVKVSGLPAPALPELAFAGRSNVGKSSLINTLVQRRKLVRTSATPGATRGLNLFRATLRGGEQLDLVDLPGYGYAKVSKVERGSWGPLIEGFLQRRAGLRAVVVIVDARRGLEPDDAQLLEFLQHLSLRAFVVATKVDKLPANKQKPAVAAIAREAGVRAFGFSSEDGTGRDALWRALTRAAGIGESEAVTTDVAGAEGTSESAAPAGSRAPAQRTAGEPAASTPVTPSPGRAAKTSSGPRSASRDGASGAAAKSRAPGASRPATKTSRRGPTGR